jgi:hypothetical protein
MEATIFEYLSSQGVFAVLFSGLLIYVLRMIKYREEQYFNSINVFVNIDLSQSDHFKSEPLLP